MSVEKVAHDFIQRMNDFETTKSQVTADALVSGGMLPHAMPALEALNIMVALSTAMPDLKFDIESVTVDGNQATVKAKWSGTQTGTLNLGMMGMPGAPAVPPTGKKVSVKDAFIVTVQGDKVSHMAVMSPADGGIPAALAQMGVKMPSM